MKKILIVGATSAMAEAAARRYAARGDTLFLMARNEERLAALASDLRIRGAVSVACCTFDATAFDGHALAVQQAIEAMQGMDVALIAHGSLGEQKPCEQNASLALQEFNVNLLSVVSVLTPIANHFEAQGSGSIAVLSSVAGDRGRQSNYIYGAAKGGLSVFLQGLRNRLARRGVQVLTVKPGFVDTPMTAAFKKGPLWATPDNVAAGIIRAIDGRKDVVYLPSFWSLIMFIIRNIPERIFKKMQL